MVDDEDKRKEQRILDEIAVFLERESSPDKPDDISALSLTKTLDVSASGLKVACDYSLPLNSVHQLCVEVLGQRFKLVAEVVWFSETPEEYLLGFQLIESKDTQIESWRNYIKAL